MLTLNKLKNKNYKKSVRVGRGNGSGIGTYSGRGLKGQKSRSGGKGGLKLMGLKQTFKKIHKAAGFVSPYKKDLIINLNDLEKKYSANSKVNLPGYKILGTGKLTKKLTVYASAYSKNALDSINKAGGKAITCGKK